MKNEEVTIKDETLELGTLENTSRRGFLGKLGKAAIIGAAAGTIGAKPFFGGKDSVAEAAVADYNSSTRTQASFNYRVSTANAENIDVGVQADNGDKDRYEDFSGLHSKALVHDSLGIPNAAAELSLIRALTTGNQTDFANILVGTPGGGGNSRLNGPQVALAFDLEGLDSHATVIPPAPTTRGSHTAAEQAFEPADQAHGA